MLVCVLEGQAGVPLAVLCVVVKGVVVVMRLGCRWVVSCGIGDSDGCYD